MRKIQLPILLAAFCTAFSLLATASPHISFDVESPAETEEIVSEIAPQRNTSAMYSETLKGAGTAEDPFLISCADDFLYFAGQVNAGNTDYASAYYMQSADIDLSDTAFVPVGTKKHPFTGSYEGANFRISFKGSYSGNTFGIFGYAQAADFYNMDILLDADVRYNDTASSDTAVLCAGGVCGYYKVANGATNEVSGCSVSGKIAVYNDRDATSAGGIFGYLEARTVRYGFVHVTDCTMSADLDISSTLSPFVGGLSGYVKEEGKGKSRFERCYIDGSISAVGIADTCYKIYVGGVAGWMSIDPDGWSIWESMPELYANTPSAVNIRDCVVASPKLYAEIVTSPGSSKALIGWLSGGASEDVVVENCYYLKNDTIVPNGKKLSITEIASPEKLYSFEFLTKTLHFDMSSLWTWKEGESVSLRFEKMCILAHRYDSKLVVKTLGCDSGMIAVAYRSSEGKVLQIEWREYTGEMMTFDIPQTDSETPLISVFLIGPDGLMPLAGTKKL